MWWITSHQSTKPIILSAPLCGYTRRPLRNILSEYSYDTIFTEMVSVDAICYKNKATELIYDSPAEISNIGIQLVGSKIDNFLSAVNHLSKLNRFNVFDINCGCPVNKVMKTGGGSALLNNPDLIYEIIHSLKTRFPHLYFSAKIRIGITSETKNYHEVSQAIEKAGASFITIHGRTQRQIYNGPVDFQALSHIKRNLKIPVIGNGGVFSPEDAKLMLDSTGIDGVMLSRGMIGNPWLESQIRSYLKTGSYVTPSQLERVQMMKQHFLYENEFEPNRGFKEFKKIGLSYLKGMDHIKQYKILLALSSTSKEMLSVINELEEKIIEKDLVQHAS